MVVNKKELVDKIKTSDCIPCKLYTKEQLDEMSFYLKDIFIGRIQKVINLDRKGLNRNDLYNNIAKDNMILLFLKSAYFMDIESGICYKSSEIFTTSKGNKYKLVPMSSFERAYRHSSLVKNLQLSSLLTAENLKYIRDNENQAIIY